MASKTLVLYGEYELTMDEKNRLVLPAEVRRALEPERDGEAFFVVIGVNQWPWLYPERGYEGLVSTITDEAPIMNWIYVDRETNELKYGVRVDAQPNLTGPFDCTRQDRRLTFENWEDLLQ